MTLHHHASLVFGFPAYFESFYVVACRATICVEPRVCRYIVGSSPGDKNEADIGIELQTSRTGGVFISVRQLALMCACQCAVLARDSLPMSAPVACRVQAVVFFHGFVGVGYLL